MSTAENTNIEFTKRIKLVMHHYEMSKNSFSLAIGHRSVIKSIDANKIPSGVNLFAIHKRFPELNMDWLLTGRGHMFIQSKESKEILGAVAEDSNPYVRLNQIDNLVNSLQELANIVKEKL